MSYFPQLTTGAGVEYPIRLTRRWYREANTLEGGERMYVPGPNYRTVEWEITFQDLTDSEVGAIRDLYIDSKGTYGSFTFVDPTTNLFSWSEDYAPPAWQPGLLSCAGGAGDPIGGTAAWTVSNPAEGLQQLTQGVSIPSAYVACMSVWLRAETPVTAYLTRNGISAPCAVTSQWKRFARTLIGSAAEPVFGLGLDAGTSVQAFGFQLEAQPYPSMYNPTQKGRGIYSQARFKDSDFHFRSEGPGRTSCDISLVSLY